MKTIRTTALAASALAAVLTAAPASASTIILNGVDSITNQGAKRGFQIAAAYWANQLTNDTTIVFNVNFDSLPPNVLGSTGSSGANARVTDVYAGLVNNANSALDIQAVSALGTQLAAGGGYALNALVTSVEDGSTYSDTNRSYNNQILYANTSVMKALGVAITDPNYDGTDADITFSSDFTFDFDPTDGITAGTSDFIGVAVHEMGHALGFVSGVDYYDLIECPNGPYCGALDDSDMESDSWLSVLDMFRYGSEGQLDWTVNSPSYFSFDNGATQFNGNSKFSSGDYNGDGWQASHWQAPRDPNDPDFFSCSQPKIGIMNPYLCGGQGGIVTASDLAAMDAMGWNTRIDVLNNTGYTYSTSQIYSQFIGQVPEPAVWMQLILGFGVIGGAYRSARRRKATAAAA